MLKSTAKSQLNTATPGTSNAQLGDVLDDLITKHNALQTAFNAQVATHNALLAKLDLDVGITDVDYGSTLAGVDAASTVNDLGSPR